MKNKIAERWRSRNRSKYNAYMRSWYRKPGNATKTLAKNKERHDRLLAIIRAEKDKPCADCNHEFHFSAMEFDHHPGTVKKFNVGDGWRNTEKALREEIAKCDVVCSNCHHIRTWKRKSGDV